MISEFISTYLYPMLGSFLTAIFAFVGLKIKTTYEKYVKDKTTQSIVNTTVKYVEQVFKELDGPAKLEKALENAQMRLNDAGIKITELELRVLVESACNGLKNGLKGDE